MLQFIHFITAVPLPTTVFSFIYISYIAALFYVFAGGSLRTENFIVSDAAL